MAQRAPTVVRVLALPDVREDAERRARGVSIVDWLEAPRPPATRGECEGKEQGCPALRCKFHLGRVGEAAGYSCWLPIAAMPDGNDPNAPCGGRTFDLIGRVLGATGGQAKESAAAIKAYDSGCHKVEELDEETLMSLKVRGFRKRHT